MLFKYKKIAIKNISISESILGTTNSIYEKA